MASTTHDVVTVHLAPVWAHGGKMYGVMESPSVVSVILDAGIIGAPRRSRFRSSRAKAVDPVFTNPFRSTILCYDPIPIRKPTLLVPDLLRPDHERSHADHRNPDRGSGPGRPTNNHFSHFFSLCWKRSLSSPASSDASWTNVDWFCFYCYRVLFVSI